MKHCKNYVKAIVCIDLFDVATCIESKCRSCPAGGGDPVRKYISLDHAECRICANRSVNFAVFHNVNGDEGILCDNVDLED